MSGPDEPVPAPSEDEIHAAIFEIYERCEHKSDLAEDLGTNLKALSHAVRKQKGRKLDLLKLGAWIRDRDGQLRDGATKLIRLIARIGDFDAFARIEPDAFDRCIGYQRVLARHGHIGEMLEHEVDEETQLVTHLRTRRANPSRGVSSEGARAIVGALRRFVDDDGKESAG